MIFARRPVQPQPHAPIALHRPRGSRRPDLHDPTSTPHLAPCFSMIPRRSSLRSSRCQQSRGVRSAQQRPQRGLGDLRRSDCVVLDTHNRLVRVGGDLEHDDGADPARAHCRGMISCGGWSARSTTRWSTRIIPSIRGIQKYQPRAAQRKCTPQSEHHTTFVFAGGP